MTEEAVVSALRRYGDRHPHQALAEPLQLLPQGRIGVRSGLALFTLARTYSVQTTVLEAWTAAGVRDTLAILPSRKTLKVLTEEASAQDFSQAFGHRQVDSVRSPVALLEIRFDDTRPTVSVLALVLSKLGHNRIEVLEAMSCWPVCSIIVDAEDKMAAFNALSELTT